MLVRQRLHEHTEWELLKWMILMALACVIALGVLTGVAGAADRNPVPRDPTSPAPANATKQLDRWTTTREESQFQAAPAVADLAIRVWQALELQHTQKYDTAIATWHTLDLSSELTVWKQVALGQAYLATGDIDSATEVLLRAQDRQSDNPVVHYCGKLLAVHHPAYDFIVED